MKIRATPLELLAVTMLLIMAVLFAGAKCFGQEEAILWSVSGNDSARIYKGTKQTRAFTDSEYRSELADAFRDAAERYQLPVYLLVAMAYYETVYRDQTGDNGRSKGIMQVGKMGRSQCGHDLKTVRGQVMCGAYWLDAGRRWCNSLDGGLYAFINGSCTAKNARAKRAFVIRKRMQVIMEGMSK